MILSNYAIKFRTAVFVFIAVLVVLGVYSYMTLPREGVPNITIPFVFVTATYEGTAPAEMETLVTLPLEERFADLEGVKELTSTTAEGVSLTSIEFLAGRDIDAARQRVKDKVDLAGPDLPQDLDEPLVDAFNFSSDAPIFIVSLWGEVAKERLRILAEDLQERIEQVTGVKEAGLSGVREREIRVEPDLRRLAAYRIPMSELCRAITRENTTISAGNIEMAGNKFQVRVPGEFDLVDEMRGLVVADRAGGPVYLRDVAAVTDTFKDLASIARLNGKPSVALNVTKRSGENSVALIDRVEAVLDAAVLPPGVQRTVVYDESDYVDEMLIELENNVLSGFILVIIVLVVFMGGRNSLFVALAIPFSMLIAFTLMNLLGYTLNMIVLFSLVIAVGMLVDNAIVIVENIYRHRTEGESRVEAARRGAGEVAWAVITSTLTTCAAFSPLLFWPDVMGQFMGFMPRTLIVVLSSSLFVALVINPAVCSALMSGGGRPAVGSRKERHPFVAGYERLLHGALRRRLPVLLIGFAVLVVTIQLYARYGQGVELFPETEPRNAQVTVQYPQGTAIETTDAALRAIEELLPAYRDIEFFLTTVGSGERP